MSDRYSFSSYLTNGLFTVFGVLTVQEWAAAVGIILGLLTFAVNFYIRYQQNQREIELHALHTAIAAQNLKMTPTSEDQ